MLDEPRALRDGRIECVSGEEGRGGSLKKNGRNKKRKTKSHGGKEAKRNGDGNEFCCAMSSRRPYYVAYQMPGPNAANSFANLPNDALDSRVFLCLQSYYAS